MAEFKTSAAYQPTGDQPEAIARRSEGLRAGERFQTLLGATGTGKTATMAWIAEQVQKPTLLIAHNKTLAAQLCNELREFFPSNAVEYFVSYYDYYQPEAYVPQADLYIEKDSSQNDDIARRRLAATSSLFTRRDVIVVASVSCIYGLGSPEEWRDRMIWLELNEEHDRDLFLRKLIDSQYVRNDTVLGRGRFRVKGDVVEIQPANQETAYRISFFGDEVEQITHFDPLSGEVFATLDNRPLRFDEFLRKVQQLGFVSATPGPFELRHSTVVAEQLIRPTFLVDPEVELRETKNQIDDLLNEIRRREEAGERVLVTTLTKKMSEDLTDYLLESGVKARYLHSEIDTLERISIIRELRLGEYDVLDGVNLLREGLDTPEVALVAILDADKEGFLRGRTALVQTIGRAARNVNGRVLMYADKLTEAIKGAIDETDRRRGVQLVYNEEHGTKPLSIVKGVSDIAEFLALEQPHVPRSRRRRGADKVEGMSREELEKLVVTLEEEMFQAAEELRFEYAAKLRDELKELRRDLNALVEAATA